MKARFFPAAVLVLFLLGAAAPAAAQVEAASTLESVVVYPDRAAVKRSAAVAVKKGMNAVRLVGLTAALIDESVEAGVKGGKLADVKVERTFLAKVRQEKMRGLEEKLEAVNRGLRALGDEASAIGNSVEFYRKVNPFPKDQKVSSQEIEAHVKFVEKSLGESLKAAAVVEEKIRTLSEEKKGIEQEMKSLRSSREESKNILLSVFSDRDGRVEVTCSYTVRGVGWHPQYEVRADSQGGKIEMSSLAVLRQNTGEDWKGVALEISTARPAVRGPLPELSGWHLDVYQPRPPAASRPFDDLRARSEMMRESKTALMESAKEEAPPEPEVRADATAFSFVLPGRADIPADNQPHRLLLASAAKEAKFSYLTVPKRSGFAYLRADLNNPFPFPLPPGGVNIFIDGKFVSTAAFPRAVLGGEKMELSLGVDETLKVERKLEKRFTEETGTFSKETRENYEYVLEIANGKTRGVEVEVKDQYPVSRNEKIKVELKSPAKGEAAIGSDGIISWSLKLSPGEKRKVKTAFQVTYPREVKIVGLE